MISRLIVLLSACFIFSSALTAANKSDLDGPGDSRARYRMAKILATLIVPDTGDRVTGVGIADADTYVIAKGPAVSPKDALIEDDKAFLADVLVLSNRILDPGRVSRH